MSRVRIVGRVVAAGCVAAAVAVAPGLWTVIPAVIVAVLWATEAVAALRRRRQTALAERFRRELLGARTLSGCDIRDHGGCRPGDGICATCPYAPTADVHDLPRRRQGRQVRRG